MNRIEVLIPCYNESTTIREVITDHYKLLNESKLFDDFRIVVLNDGSLDNSLSILTKLSKEFSKLIILSNEKPSGIFSAFNQLISQSIFEWIYITSGDNQYPSSILNNILKNFDNSSDLYLAKRINKFEIYNLNRQIISFLYRIICFLISGVDPIDPGSTKLVKRALLFQKYNCKYLAKDAELIIRTKKMGRSVKVVDAEFGNRKYGKSSATKLSVLFKTYIDCLNLFKYRFN